MNWKSPCNTLPPGLKLPAGSFSWSLRRRKLFEFCPRAYFNHYYGAAGGWDSYAPEAQRRLYLLKNLRKAEEWAVDIFATCIRELAAESFTIQRFNRDDAARRLNSSMQQKFRHGCVDILSETWRNDARTINLFEIFYGVSPDKEDKVLAYVKARLNQLLAGFREHPLFDTVVMLDRLKLKIVQPPVSFMLGELETWVSPTLIWRDEDRIKVLAVRGNIPMTDAEIKLSAGLFQLMAEQLHRCPPENVDVIYYFTNQVNQKPEIRLAAPNINHREVIEEVSADCQQMLEKVIPGGMVREQDFPGWFAATQNICPTCRFYAYCHPAQSM